MWAIGTWSGLGGGGTILIDEYRLEIEDTDLDIIVDDQSFVIELTNEEYLVEIEDTDLEIEV